MIDTRNFHHSVRRGWLSVVVAGILLALGFPCRANAQGGFEGPGHYEIVNLKSGKVLDMDRNDQTSVIQYSSQGTDNQVWEIRPAGDSGFFILRNAMNGSVLEAAGPRNSAPVRTSRFDGGANQQWRFDTGKDGNALIISRLGMALDIPGGTSADGARVQTYEIDGDSNQRFMFRRVSTERRDGHGGDQRHNSGEFAVSGEGAVQPEHPWGTIAADPNPCRIERRESVCTSYITWSTRGVTQAKVSVTNDSQRGIQEKEFGSTLACESSRCVAPWITRGKTYEFTLYDFSSGRRGQRLASVTVTAAGDRRR